MSFAPVVKANVDTGLSPYKIYVPGVVFQQLNYQQKPIRHVLKIKLRNIPKACQLAPANMVTNETVTLDQTIGGPNTFESEVVLAVGWQGNFCMSGTLLHEITSY